MTTNTRPSNADIENALDGLSVGSLRDLLTYALTVLIDREDDLGSKGFLIGTRAAVIDGTQPVDVEWTARLLSAADAGAAIVDTQGPRWAHDDSTAARATDAQHRARRAADPNIVVGLVALPLWAQAAVADAALRAVANNRRDLARRAGTPYPDDLYRQAQVCLDRADAVTAGEYIAIEDIAIIAGALHPATGAALGPAKGAPRPARVRRSEAIVAALRAAGAMPYSGGPESIPVG